LDRRSPLVIPAIAAALYFSEGLPYGIVTELFTAHLGFHHVPDRTATLVVNTAAFAWTAKFLWSPLVDVYGTYRRWIAGALVVMLGIYATLAVQPDLVGSGFWLLCCGLALASATQDIAADAFTIRVAPEGMLGRINAIRVMAYRAALMLGGGGLLIVAGKVSWRAAYGCATVIAAAILLMTLALPDDRGEQSVRHDLLGGLKRMLARRHAVTILALVFLYRAGELAIVAIIKLFWIHRGYSAAEIGTVTSVFGVLVSVAGAATGGWLVDRIGLWRALLWLGLAQAMSNLGYALVATLDGGRAAMYAAAVSENFGFGLGTAAFLAFLMAVCDREHAATEYALLTAIFGLTRVIVGSASGSFTTLLGYPAYFWLTVFLGVPALLLLPRLREELATK
jgi:PAT family beta-lactamase induction signal transducer AmpG